MTPIIHDWLVLWLSWKNLIILVISAFGSQIINISLLYQRQNDEWVYNHIKNV